MNLTTVLGTPLRVAALSFLFSFALVFGAAGPLENIAFAQDTEDASDDELDFLDEGDESFDEAIDEYDVAQADADEGAAEEAAASDDMTAEEEFETDFLEEETASEESDRPDSAELNEVMLDDAMDGQPGTGGMSTDDGSQAPTSPSEDSQTAQNSDAQNDNPARKRSGTGAAGSIIDEVIVTSAKRDVEAAEVPVAISTLGEDTLDFGGVNQTGITSFYVPNLGVYNEPTWSFISIRGQGSGLNAGFEQSVGIVYDGVNLGRSSFLTNSLMDAYQVEILRGPQGTVTGKNAVAGAYVVTSAKPHFEWGGKYDISAPSFKGPGDRDARRIPYEGSIAVTGPIIEDKLAIRFAGYRTEQDGRTFNTKTQQFMADETQKGYRVSVLGVLWEQLEIDANYTFIELSENGVNHEIAYMGGGWEELMSQYDEVEDNEFNETSSMDFPHFTRRDSEIATMNANWHFAEGYKATAIAGWAATEGFVSLDADWGPAPVVNTETWGTYEQYSIEFNLSRNLESRANIVDEQADSGVGAAGWVMEVFYFHNVIDNYNETPLVPGGALDLTPNQLCEFLAATLGCDFVSLNQTGQVLTGEQQNNSRFYQEQDSYAAFAEFALPVPYLERWLVTFGARYTYEEKTVDFMRELPPDQNLNLWFYVIPDLETFSSQQTRSYSGTTARVSLQYFPRDLDANIFFTMANGWKAGGFNAAAGIPDELAFDPETSWTIEAGIKVRFWDEKIGTNITVFRSEFQDLQTSTYNGEKFVVRNAGSARSQGIEFEMEFIPFEDIDLTYGVQASGLHSRFIDYKNGPCIAGQDGSCDRSGQATGGHVPWQTAMGLTWNHPFKALGQNLTLVTSTSYVLRPEGYGQDDGDWRHNTTTMELIQARVGLKDPDDLWHVYIACSVCNGHPISGGFDVPIFAGTHAHVPYPGGPAWEIRAYGRF